MLKSTWLDMSWNYGSLIQSDNGGGLSVGVRELW